MSRPSLQRVARHHAKPVQAQQDGIADIGRMLLEEVLVPRESSGRKPVEPAIRRGLMDSLRGYAGGTPHSQLGHPITTLGPGEANQRVDEMKLQLSIPRTGRPDQHHLWAKLSETKIPFMLHIGPGTKTQPKAFQNNGRERAPDLHGAGETLRLADYLMLSFAPRCGWMGEFEEDV